ncbi:hypothetical protein [Candidatus Nitrosocosmicus arcticus]|uniref:Uncharacterized protein n=1 Tax=Candidatus Nitrosocosmicus arcticus TaxID=2035267 RepID=A0A557STZ1_9ARCH|nr:hypothetical protein [Candidatus Nitrosocosmicus arcticus]TVP40081.1 hypothetical protein NARC_100144 [Candidatus Nitrosocosmicus arcticus]
MIDRLDLIRELDQILQIFDNKKTSLLNIQKRAQNDARVTFYKHSLNTLDSTIHFLIFTHKHLGNTTWWKETYIDYNLSNRSFAKKPEDNYPREFDYIDQHIGNSYYIFIFSSFEHSFRLISKEYDPTSFEQNKNSFESLFKNIIKGIIPTENKNNFIEIATTIRNSIHNNGAYISRNSKDRPIIDWDGKLYRFNHQKPIETDLWKLNLDFTRELLHIFDKIIEHQSIASKRYIYDSTE